MRPIDMMDAEMRDHIAESRRRKIDRAAALEADLRALVGELREPAPEGPHGPYDAAHPYSLEAKHNHALTDRLEAILAKHGGECGMSEREGCDVYSRGEPAGDCEGDGHYLCRECVHHDPAILAKHGGEHE